MRLNQYYKSKIKSLSARLKRAKTMERNLRSKSDRKLLNTTEYQRLEQDLRQLIGTDLTILKMRKKMRHLFLAYALIRNKDPYLVEKNYPSHDQEYLEQLMIQIKTDCAKETDQSFAAALELNGASDGTK